ncbi:membrane-associated protein, putative [Bodo saltans]|uniref:Membrane-associated protein, putative n=1 Tax=Bodo saltans TaxID=75058 RepID=A0A0S4JF71_BODSA|nr:membrane-associated protein, putative [Bodo saltans]|eukprot:CUG89119.1 membrane-associated protein, putative [Bodo saltans]
MKHRLFGGVLAEWPVCTVLMFVVVVCQGSPSFTLEPRCQTHCAANDVVVSPTLCLKTIDFGRCLDDWSIYLWNNISHGSGNYTYVSNTTYNIRFTLLSNKNCTTPPLPCTSGTIVGSDCLYGGISNATIHSHNTFQNSTNTTSVVTYYDCPPNWHYDNNTHMCYNSSIPLCVNGSYRLDSSTCTMHRIEACQDGYVEIGNTSLKCHGNFTAPTIWSTTDCTSTNSTSGCMWCSATNVCVSNSTSCPVNCSLAPKDICSLPPSACHWCSQRHNNTCKPRNPTVWTPLRWRDEVDCVTESVTPSSTSEWSMSNSLSSHSSATLTLNVPITPTDSPTSTFTSMATPSHSRSASRTITLSVNESASSSRSNSQRSHTRTSSPSFSSIATPTLPSLSLSHTVSPSPTISGVSSTSDPTLSYSSSRTSVSVSASFYLSPCFESHLSILSTITPYLFHLTLNSTILQQFGIRQELLTIRDGTAITDRFPYILRNLNLSNATISYVWPSPYYETPNVDGFAYRGDAPVGWLSWRDRSTLAVDMPPLSDYKIDLSEDAILSIPFEDLLLCNRTHPLSLPTPETITLASIHIEAPVVNGLFQQTAQSVSIVAYISGILSGDASSSASLQTLGVLGMQLCGQPAVRQALNNNVRTLNPLYAGVDGMVGVVVGNAVLVFGAIVLQVLSVVLLCTLAKWRRMAHIPNLVEASTTLRAPSVSIAVLFSLFQGTFYASTQVITQEGVDGGDAAMGSIAFCLLLAVPPFCVWWCTTAAANRDCFRYDYVGSNVHVVLRGAVTSVVLLPHSKIDPPAVAFRFATLVANYCSPHILVVVIPVVVPVGVSLISLWHPDGIGQCRVYFWLAIVMHVAMVCFVAILRPFRYLLTSLFFCLGYVINLTLLVCMVIAIDSPRFLAADVVNGIGFAQLAFQILNSCFRVWTVFVDIFIINSEIPLVLLWSCQHQPVLHLRLISTKWSML